MIRAWQLSLLPIIVAMIGCARSAQHVEIPGSGAACEKEMLRWLVTYHHSPFGLGRAA